MTEWYNSLSTLLIIAWVIVGAIVGLFWCFVTNYKGYDTVSVIYSLFMGWFWPVLWPIRKARELITVKWFNLKQYYYKTKADKEYQKRLSALGPVISRDCVDEIYTFGMFIETEAVYKPISAYKARKLTNGKYQQFDQHNLKQEYVFGEYNTWDKLIKSYRKKLPGAKIGYEILDKKTGNWSKAQAVTPADEPINWYVVETNNLNNLITEWCKTNISGKYIKLETNYTIYGSLDRWSFENASDATLFALRWRS